MTDDPWKDIPSPAADDLIRANRIDESIPWDFFWARSVDQRYLLVLQHSPDATPDGRLPKLKGIEVSLVDYQGTRKLLIFKLQDNTQKDIFHQLCLDIVGATRLAPDERQAVALAVARTWRWHHLLRGGSDERLSREEQKGLIGELIVLQRLILPSMPAANALDAWCGPLDAPKDFEVGQVCIEAKAKRGSAVPCVFISSMHQLDDSGTGALFLSVTDLDIAPPSQNGRTLTEYAIATRDDLLKSDKSLSEAFDALLNAAGFRWSDDYSDSQWIEGKSRLFHVRDDFPRICGNIVPQGVVEVHYTVSLLDCARFEVGDRVVLNALGAKGNVE